jgi:glyoxylate reductase
MNSERPRVVIARRLPRAGQEELERRFDVDAGELSLDRRALLERVQGAAAIVADPTVPVDAELLEAAGRSLRVVANFAVGYDNIALGACRERGVTVTNTPDVLTNATAELTVALMLAAARRLGEAERLVRAGRWQGWDPDGLLGRELSHSTIGIVGLGRIGLRVAELLQGFGPGEAARPSLVYTSQTPHPELEARLGLRRLELDELVERSDVVSLHLPLSRDTRHIVDARRLERFRPGAILVNTSRGALVDTQALAAALRGGRLGAAALDVYEDEPTVEPELLALDNVVLLPHVGSATARARDAMARLVAENVIAVLAGQPPPTPVLP